MRAQDLWIVVGFLLNRSDVLCGDLVIFDQDPAKVKDLLYVYAFPSFEVTTVQNEA